MGYPFNPLTGTQILHHHSRPCNSILQRFALAFDFHIARLEHHGYPLASADHPGLAQLAEFDGRAGAEGAGQFQPDNVLQLVDNPGVGGGYWPLDQVYVVRLPRAFSTTLMRLLKLPVASIDDH